TNGLKRFRKLRPMPGTTSRQCVQRSSVLSSSSSLKTFSKKNHDREDRRQRIAPNQADYRCSAESRLRRVDRSSAIERLVRPGGRSDRRSYCRCTCRRRVSLGPHQFRRRENELPWRIPRATAEQKSRVHL